MPFYQPEVWTVLKISTMEEPNRIVLKVEGKLAQPWTQELDRYWEALAVRLHEKTLCLDLRQVTHADQSGLTLLGTILKSASPEVLADTPLTRQFVRQARQTSNEPRRKGE